MERMLIQNWIWELKANQSGSIATELPRVFDFSRTTPKESREAFCYECHATSLLREEGSEKVKRTADFAAVAQFETTLFCFCTQLV